MRRAIRLSMVLFAVQLARGDVVHFRDGSVREGKIVQQTAEKVELEFTTPAGSLRVVYPTEKIERIEIKQTPQELLMAEYQRRATAVKPDDADGWAELGAWCAEHPMLQAEAQGAYRQAITIDPDHEDARRALGYVRYRGLWMTEEEAMGAQGYIKHDGNWIPVDAYRKLLEAELARRIAPTAREQQLATKLLEAETRAAEAERELRETQDKLSQLTRRIQRLEDDEPKTIIIRERDRYPLWLYWYPSTRRRRPRPPQPPRKTGADKPEAKEPVYPSGPIGKKLAAEPTSPAQTQ